MITSFLHCLPIMIHLYTSMLFIAINTLNMITLFNFHFDDRKSNEIITIFVLKFHCLIIKKHHSLVTFRKQNYFIYTPLNR